MEQRIRLERGELVIEQNIFALVSWISPRGNRYGIGMLGLENYANLEIREEFLMQMRETADRLGERVAALAIR